MIGQKISHFEITSKIGEGGMGEVYLAQDLSLERKVALKFLSQEIQTDEVARKRFLREARSAAAIDHPYVCNVYEIGEQDGKGFIAMEYVEGETLRDKISGCPLPIPAALQIGIEIAQALERAHSAGIVHRDLKPSNIMILPDGHVKVMDFGLAKRFRAGGEDSQQATWTGLTESGAIVGTVSYMSPEQLRIEDVDNRSDIFSLGVLMYEMLSGVHPFRESEAMETVSAILQGDAPPLGRYRQDLSDVLQYCVRKMLARDRAKRYQSVTDVHTDLQALGQGSAESRISLNDTPSSSRAQLLPWALVAVSIAALAFTVWKGIPKGGLRPSESIVVSNVALPEGLRLEHNYRRGLDLSPDGRYLAFAATGSRQDQRLFRSRNRLYIRRLADSTPRPLPGTEDAFNLAFSPDSRSIVYQTRQDGDLVLKRVPIDGGEPRSICACGADFGLSWASGKIFFASEPRDVIRAVPANGGEPVGITQLDYSDHEISHRWPSLLPNGEWLVFTALRFTTIEPNWADARIYAQSLETGERRLLVEDATYAEYSAGHLLFARDGNLYAAPFDRNRVTLSGSPVIILEGVLHSVYTSHLRRDTGIAQIGLSDTGWLAFAAGGAFPEERRALVWIDEAGGEEIVPAEPLKYGGLRISATADQVLLTTTYAPSSSLQLHDFESGVTTPKLERERMSLGVWGPEKNMITFMSNDEAGPALWTRVIDADPSVASTPIVFGGGGVVRGLAWEPNGQFAAVVYLEQESSTSNIAIMDRSGRVEEFRTTTYYESSPDFDPSGNWLAYVSDVTGRAEVYVLPVPVEGQHPKQVSQDGGGDPLWSRNGQKLYYHKSSSQDSVAFYSVSVTALANGLLDFGRPTKLFEGPYLASRDSYDVGEDGRFLAIKELASEKKRSIETFFPTSIRLLQNWPTLLKQLHTADR